MNRRRLIRVLASVTVVLALGVNGMALLQWDPLVLSASASGNVSSEELTVVTTQESWKEPGRLLAFDGSGELIYSTNRYDSYYDVDPVPGTRRSVLYVAVSKLSPADCPGDRSCVNNHILRHNLSTDEQTVVFEQLRPTGKWHDVDADGPDSYLIADIQQDAVWRLNTTTDETTYGWRFHTTFNQRQSGGPFPEDWTHLNDVERLPDGRIMLSPRNHDQVVFIEPGEGIQQNWTLGADGQLETLYEQHNPDYIPESRGGPAVVVADSQNNRIVEYQRRDGEWVESWVWADDQLKWPRDADRLPNGHTLIADSHGNRVIEVNESGEVVWSVSVGSSYDAERLGTGDESAGGDSAQALGLSSVRATSGGGGGGGGLLAGIVSTLVPAKLLNAFRFVTPGWMSYPEALTAAGAAVWLVTLVGSELYYSRWGVRSPLVRRS